MSNLLSYMAEKQASITEEVVRGVMRQCLGREPELSDAKNFSFVQHQSFPFRRFISYNDVVVGELVWSSVFKEDGRYHCALTFEPKNIIQ